MYKITLMYAFLPFKICVFFFSLAYNTIIVRNIYKWITKKHTRSKYKWNKEIIIYLNTTTTTTKIEELLKSLLLLNSCLFMLAIKMKQRNYSNILIRRRIMMSYLIAIYYKQI